MCTEKGIDTRQDLEQEHDGLGNFGLEREAPLLSSSGLERDASPSRIGTKADPLKVHVDLLSAGTLSIEKDISVIAYPTEHLFVGMVVGIDKEAVTVAVRDLVRKVEGRFGTPTDRSAVEHRSDVPPITRSTRHSHPLGSCQTPSASSSRSRSG